MVCLRLQNIPPYRVVLFDVSCYFWLCVVVFCEKDEAAKVSHEDVSEQIQSCIQMLGDVKKRNDVKEIIQAFEKTTSFNLPKNRRQ